MQQKDTIRIFYVLGDVSYNVDKLFSSQARTALRLSHFLSNFLQNVDKYEEYGNLRGDKLLNIELIFGEVLANVMGDLKIKGSGVFFDIDKFEWVLFMLLEHLSVHSLNDCSSLSLNASIRIWQLNMHQNKDQKSFPDSFFFSSLFFIILVSLSDVCWVVLHSLFSLQRSWWSHSSVLRSVRLSLWRRGQCTWRRRC